MIRVLAGKTVSGRSICGYLVVRGLLEISRSALEISSRSDCCASLDDGNNGLLVNLYAISAPLRNYTPRIPGQQREILFRRRFPRYSWQRTKGALPPQTIIDTGRDPA